ncbi:GGDEF domain-containing phosphodiesterase [Cellulomonas sp. KRMCY2]|uniref:GGDEF domain-containing phosphodiesterase n=1 Tax=Cellulomonas sp. KRMCY2 TaxID=1304865 RepID=UPI00068496C6|nr:GGDEF domain-containing phosphodiesterase [Cellulomonas sp. KRMCY2]
MTGAGGVQRGTAPADVTGELRRRQFATLLEHSPDATVILDAQGRVCEWNPAAEALLGLPRAVVIDIPARRLVPPEYRVRFDAMWAQLVAGEVAPLPDTLRLLRDGAEVSVSTHIAPTRADGHFVGAVAILRDDQVPDEPAQADSPVATGAAGAARTVPRLGILERDELTGLPGRRRLQHRLAEPVASGVTRGVAVVDVDAFALVNEAYGPDAGDAVLSELARRLVAVAGIADLGRWQADTFVLIVDVEDSAAVLEALSERVTAVLDEPFQVGAESLRLSVSMGMVTSELAPDADLLAAATDALRVAKSSGRDRGVWFSEALRTTSAGGFRLANDLHRGIQQGELRLHFQPILELATNHVVGVEALVRWERPGVGLLNPVSFIDVAERTGQIVLLGAWVARQACLVAAELVRFAGGPRSVSVNVSARQLSDPDLVEMLRAALQESGCAPSMIIIEVTESALTYDLGAATATLEAVKALGVGLDLDDFGTGYSSLLYLKHFPVDRIKIDQSFVAGLGSDYADTAIVASTIALAHSIGIQAVAEGVETAEQLAMLRQMGCDFAQGYYLSRPLGLEPLHEWLTAHVPSVVEPVVPSTVGTVGTVGADGGPSSTSVPAEPADGRDRVADLRDAVADRRDDVGDLRDRRADARDAVADVRDAIADVRDDVAGERDRMVDGPDDADGGPGTPHTMGRAARSTLARWDAQSDRTSASEDRDAEASGRAQDERHRDAAQRDRRSTASGRAQAESDRDATDGGRDATDSDRDPATGAGE